MIEWIKVTSPIGDLYILSEDEYLCGISWDQSFFEKVENKKSTSSPKKQILLEAKRQLQEYFSGARESFELPLSPRGTEFQSKVWKQLQKIPYGKTKSYGEIAVKIKNPKAMRAVGMANRCNPIPIIIPCHRVIGSNGKLTGFAGGLDLKKKLLDFEAGLSQF
ncbi:MAG: methylated-DNA--[protein]-cysteine S-methyltransferase [Bdellovibrionota bacterium]|nr:methylated-DNA--[protein]-cysteine S-methyltransferase [Bdellovibrionota bacterium]